VVGLLLRARYMVALILAGEGGLGRDRDGWRAEKRRESVYADSLILMREF